MDLENRAAIEQVSSRAGRDTMAGVREPREKDPRSGPLQVYLHMFVRGSDETGGSNFPVHRDISATFMSESQKLCKVSSLHPITAERRSRRSKTSFPGNRG